MIGDRKVLAIDVVKVVHDGSLRVIRDRENELVIIVVDAVWEWDLWVIRNREGGVVFIVIDVLWEGCTCLIRREEGVIVFVDIVWEGHLGVIGSVEEVLIIIVCWEGGKHVIEGGVVLLFGNGGLLMIGRKGKGVVPESKGGCRPHGMSTLCTYRSGCRCNVWGRLRCQPVLQY